MNITIQQARPDEIETLIPLLLQAEESERALRWGLEHLDDAVYRADADGELVASLPVMPMTLDELNDAADSFVGDIMQEPPMVSAVKQGGVPLYKLARKGIEVERKARLIHVYRFSFSRYEEPIGWFCVACTK